MGLTNTILLVSGVIVTLIGVAAFFNPHIARWINAPGGLRLKAIIAMIVGIVIMIVGLAIPFPG